MVGTPKNHPMTWGYRFDARRRRHRRHRVLRVRRHVAGEALLEDHREAPGAGPTPATCRRPSSGSRPRSRGERRLRRAHRRVLPPAVPPDPRERRVVGPGVHRVDQRGPGDAAVSAATTSRTCPGELGFYDLRVPEVRAAQAELAAGHGIDGVLLLPLLVRRPAAARAPVRRGARLGRARLPVLPLLGERDLDAARGTGRRARCSSRRRTRPTTTSRTSAALAEAFADPRYLRVDGRPLFLVYRAVQLPDPRRTDRPLAAEARPAGLGELYLCSMQTGPRQRDPPATLGFDAAVAVRARSTASRRDGAVAARLARGAAHVLGRDRPSTRVTGSTTTTRWSSEHLAAEPVAYTRYPVRRRRAGTTRRAGRERGATIITGLDARALRAVAPRRRRRASGRPSARGEPRLRERVERVGRGQPPRARSDGGARGTSRRTRALSSVHVGEQSDDRTVDARRRGTARVIALYLPQFHPDPRERRVVGPGLHRVDERRRAPGRCSPGHDQPQLPGRARLLRPAPARDARGAGRSSPRAHGIEAFCYWHYWFAGRRLLERPFQEVLAQRRARLPVLPRLGEPDLVDDLDRRPQPVLIEQTYPGPDDHERHFDAVLPAFRDPRYFRVDGRPLFFVYRPNDLPDAGRVRRPVARRSPSEPGLPGLYLVGETKSGWTAAAMRLRRRAAGAAVRGVPGRRITGPRRRRGSNGGAGGPDRVPVRHDSRIGRAATLPHPELPIVALELGQHARASAPAAFVLTGATPEAFGRAMRARGRRGRRASRPTSASCS